MIKQIEVPEGHTAMALPTEALKRLRDRWERGDDIEMKALAVSLIRDIFDGQDGYLHRINEALGK